MPEFLQFGFMQRAFAAGAVMAIVCPLIGVFLVPRRLSLIADTLAHVALAGVAIGLLMGASPIVGLRVRGGGAGWVAPDGPRDPPGPPPPRTPGKI